MAVVEDDGTISLANTLFLKLLGYSHEEVENRINYFEIFGEHFRDQVQDYHRRRGPAMQPYPPVRGTGHKQRGKDAGCHHYDRAVSRTRQSVISIIDVTDQKQTEDELRLFKTSVDRAYEEVFWLDFEGNMLYVNDAATRNTGYSRRASCHEDL